MNDAEFTEIDRRLFDRLHRGSLGPITFRLKDGGALSGHLLAVRRSGATGNVIGALGGEIRLDCAGGQAFLAYDQIGDIE